MLVAGSSGGSTVTRAGWSQGALLDCRPIRVCIAWTAVVNSVPSRSNGIVGVGDCKTVNRSSKMVAIVSSAEIVGFLQQTGKKSTVLDVRGALVSTI